MCINCLAVSRRAMLAGGGASPGLGTDKDIVNGRSEIVAGSPAYRGVVIAGSKGLERPPANNGVLETTCQCRERNATNSRVKAINTSDEAIVT